MSKYSILKETVNAWIRQELQNIEDYTRVGDVNSPGLSMSLGALSAYEQVLVDIEELEKEVAAT